MLQFKLIMIYIIHEISVLLKITKSFKCFLDFDLDYKKKQSN